MNSGLTGKKTSSYKWPIKFKNLVLDMAPVQWLIRARPHEP